MTSLSAVWRVQRVLHLELPQEAEVPAVEVPPVVRLRSEGKTRPVDPMPTDPGAQKWALLPIWAARSW